MDQVVIDTNVVLDLFVFDDPAVAPLRAALAHGRVTWIATAAMRDELRRVLDYPHLARRLDDAGSDAVLAAFDRHVRRLEPADKSPFTCRDPDDQRFIDLAVAHGAALLSKDTQVLALARRLARVGVQVTRSWAPQAERAGA
ncbi:MAG: putative toxin-antitoxin system toxin component, PIN family [Hydrogenophaga sp.]|uniref:putative toxin-antitoxin system toxin component, PIN family n=1 Tax=Hydrogenophaga sp. TaxID=1904254 RepID=UPI0016974063|nr:putative toxin-antitoxin system toxin component, PIN family [Hydrogenophaga sp.]NIM40059.1 putative toxin-antitoxin system toxin component, PIN family [Hydrogenophaga sp.]NIN25255.1 putative toxin-antitoxin system toxin component, PIN family [Hydrogenophaga sp.]NIN29822.1 putative toxin-antitoxin system toxin component, PIN family [Hydrogenophaga sp.]NIN54294.1 putative toxin-antitoxin system toxin component, PIN family [Hydrogenophaga sp.]NIO50707.1 putative toxin-antitoxin system toxin co